MSYKNIPWDLILSHLKHEANEQEINVLNEWRSSGANESLYKELESLWNEVRNELEGYHPDVSYYWKRLEIRMKKKKQSTYTISAWKYRFAVGAAFLFLLLSVSGSFFLGTTIGKPEVAMQTYSALNGKSQIVLPDGSTVWLNMGSTLSYKTSFIGKREVWLEGEALFQVEKDVKHPFTVSADKVRINVYGTKFNVKAYPDNADLRVALLEGQIALRINEKETYMKPGELVLVDKQTDQLRKVLEDVHFESFWANNLCSFNAKPLSYICKYLERWYNISIALDPKIENTCYTFTITDEPLETILQIMSRINPIQYSFEENKHVIISDVKQLKKGSL